MYSPLSSSDMEAQRYYTSLCKALSSPTMPALSASSVWSSTTHASECVKGQMPKLVSMSLTVSCSNLVIHQRNGWTKIQGAAANTKRDASFPYIPYPAYVLLIQAGIMPVWQTHGLWWQEHVEYINPCALWETLEAFVIIAGNGSECNNYENIPLNMAYVAYRDMMWEIIETFLQLP